MVLSYFASAMVDFLTVPQGSYRAKVGVEHHDIGDAERRQVTDSRAA